MTPSPAIQRICAKVGEAGIKLNPPLQEVAVRDFERLIGVQLPGEYREFLIHLGNGGSGPPYYGLRKLGELPPDFTSPASDVSKAFPFTKPWIWEDDDISIEGNKYDVQCGVLILGTDGCGQYWALVVNGPDFGKIWMLCDVGILPLDPKLTFLEWYEAWLDGKRDWFAT